MSRTELAFIGAGNMAEAIARGILKAGVLKADEIAAADPAAARRELFQHDLSIHTGTDAAEAVAAAPVIIIAVKPQMFDAALRPVATLFGPGKLVLSICAGISTAHIEEVLAKGSRVVRAMPNTPMLVGRGMAAISAGKHATEADLATAARLLGAAAEVVRVPEGLMDAVTAVSGSGPAYFFYFVELLAAAGVKLGLPEDQAQQLARVTFEGAAKLLAETGEDAAVLRRKVTSPGGTTEAAIKTFDAMGLPATITEAVKAARNRGRQLGK
jgi:pyrroline-5-carboxylate reductase